VNSELSLGDAILLIVTAVLCSGSLWLIFHAANNPGYRWVRNNIAADPRLRRLECPKCGHTTFNPDTRWIKAVDHDGYGGIPAHMEVSCRHCWYYISIYEWTREEVTRG